MFESESLSLISDSLSKLTLNSMFTMLKLGLSGTQQVVAEFDDPNLGCVRKE